MKFHRIAAGEYQTSNGDFRLYRLPEVKPPAWNIERCWNTGPDEGKLEVDGAASKRDALELFHRNCQ